MINFATGAMLTSADASDAATIFSAYGVWDGAPAANTAWLSQTLTERCYTPGTTSAATPCAQRVRTVTANVPDWTSGATHHKAWKVALPAGEKVVGDGSFIENSRFYFTSSNPNIANTVQKSTVKGENWLMELDYLSGGVQNSPFLDLSGDHSITDDDRVKNSASPPVAVTTTDGIPVGKVVGIGVMSQPILVQLSSLNNTLFNQNPDITIEPVVLGSGAGVTGGHFDIDIFYAPPVSGAQAQATITVGNGSSSSGQTSGYPATLGAIKVDGVIIVPALPILDLPDGAASNYTNAKTIASNVTNGFTATRSNGVITIKAPAGTQFNGKAITIGLGGSQTLVAAKAAVPAVLGVTGRAPTPGQLVITDVQKGQQSASIKCGSTYIGTTASFTTSNSNTSSTRLQALFTTINNTSVNGYTLSCGDSFTSPVICTVTAPIGASACKGGFTLSKITATTTGPGGGVNGVDGVNAVTAVPGSDAVLKSGWTDFYPAVTATSFNNNGVDAASVGDTCADTTCKYDTHFHQYDDVYDVTGLNVLNPSSATVNIKLGIPSLTQKFKVIVQNQYLSPAVKLHIGNPNYVFDEDFGYISLKNYSTWTTSSAQLESLQTYQRDPFTVWPYTSVAKEDVTDAMRALPKPIGSFAFNMPLDALTAKDWWGGTSPDVRVGLHPIQPQCMWQAEGTHDGNMYKPVIPPVNGVAGPGTKGWTNSTTPKTATGARHGGALIFQIIRDTTPNDALEMNVENRPEYGWRVKSELYSQYVLEEYGTYWHHPNGKCFYDTGWTKTPPADNGSSSLSTKAVGSTDPNLGNLSAGSLGTGTILSLTVTVVGDVTTTVITYTVGANATIVRTVNKDGSATIVTTDTLGVSTTQTVANTDGSLKTGGDERGSGVAKTGRISWRELVAP